jgi:hypothetical protein
MNITKNIAGSMLAIAILVFGAVSVSAAVDHEAVKNAFENKDYASFQEVTSESKRFQDVSEADFSKIIEAHELAQSGDKEAAKAIFDELGINPPRMRGHQGEKHNEIRDAVENGDYDAWAAHVAERGGDPTKSDFEIIQQAHEFHENGDHDSAKELLEENGIERPKHKGERGKRFRGENRPQQEA